MDAWDKLNIKLNPGCQDSSAGYFIELIHRFLHLQVLFFIGSVVTSQGHPDGNMVTKRWLVVPHKAALERYPNSAMLAKQRSRNYRYSLQYRLSKQHIDLSALWVIAGGRGATSAPNLSQCCFKLTFRCWRFLSARRAAADVITPSHPLQPAGECQRPTESPRLTSQTFYLTFFFIHSGGRCHDFLWNPFVVSCLFIIANYNGFVENHFSCGSATHRLLQVPLGPSQPVCHDVQIHSSVTPGSWGLSAGR